MAEIADLALRHDVACPFCGLACDDLTVAVDDRGRPAVQAHGCALSRDSFARDGGEAKPRIGGRAVDLDQAVAAAAEILLASRLPLFGGLATDIGGMRAVMRIAERMGGVVDHAASEGLFRNLRVVQDHGWMTTTLSEIRNHCDLLLIVGPDPSGAFPRFLERCIARKSTLYAEDAPPPRVCRVGPASAAKPSGAAVDEIECLPERLPQAVAALRCLIGGRPIDTRQLGGLSIDRLAALAAELKAARYGVVAWISGALDPVHADMLTLSLADLVRDLNRWTRAAAMPLGGSDNVLGVNQLCTWQSGVPLRTSFQRGVPEHDSHLFAASRLLESGEADALIWITALHPLPAPSTGVPIIAIAAADTPFERAPEVFIPVGIPGIDHAGEIFRADAVVALHLPALRRAVLPSVAEVVDRIDRAIAASGVRR